MVLSDKEEGQAPVFVSACLLGLRTRYDGSGCRCEGLVKKAQTEVLAPICPEQLGGLPTPRPPAAIVAGNGCDVLDGRARVLDAEGEDVTENFLRGARIVADLAEQLGVRRAVLKEGSPSCGVTQISRDGARVPGQGVMTALLRRKGIVVDGAE